MTVPDYTHSLLALAASILRYYGAPTPHPGLPALDRLLAARPYRNVAVLLFDGLGMNVLERHLPPDSFLRRHLAAPIRSVFPPTTTAATVSVETGLSPAEHGWLGWSLWFEEVGAAVSVFPNTLSGSNGVPAADYHVARRYLPYVNLLDQIRAATGGAVAAEYVSPFSAAHPVSSVPELCGTVRRLCEGEGRRYLYAYWNQPDYDIHDHGVGHPRITALVEALDRAVAALCAALTDTLVLVIADHGMTDVEYVRLADHPALGACLARVPSLELRVASFTLRPGMEDQFVSAYRAVFPEHLLLSRNEVLASGLLGPGKTHPRVPGFLGDYLGVATGPRTLEVTGRPPEELFRAAHAGLSEAELTVPLIAVRCGCEK